MESLTIVHIRILLDEINLASSETLEALIPLLASNMSSLTLVEKGTLEPVPQHPSFRIFGSMNPATDVGKKNLPMCAGASLKCGFLPLPLRGETSIDRHSGTVHQTCYCGTPVCHPGHCRILLISQKTSTQQSAS